MGSRAPASIANAVLKHAQLKPQFNDVVSALPAESRQDGRIPIAVKDNITTSDLPTTCASGILADYLSPFPATVVTNLSKKYAPVSKTNMDEFGMGSHSLNSFFGATLNPLVPSSSPGGSSGGSAAAVASGEYNVALGTDTGGSVRLPAAYTGVTGLKPSYGRLSRWGVVPYANSLDTVGIFSSTPQLAAEVLLEAEGADAKDPTCITDSGRKRMTSIIRKYRSTRGKKLRIGVPAEYNITSLSPSMRTAWSRTLSHLRKNGHSLHPISLPSTKHALSAYYIIATAEASSNLAKYDSIRYGSSPPSPSANDNGVLYSSTRGALFGAEVQKRILLGSFALSSSAMDNYFLHAQRVRSLVQADFDRVFACPNPLHPERLFDLTSLPEAEVQMADKKGPAQVDYIVVPTAPGPPPSREELGRMTETEGWAVDVFTVPASLAGIPGCSVPVEGGKGLGVQVLGQYFDDEGVLEMASEICEGKGE